VALRDSQDGDTMSRQHGPNRRGLSRSTPVTMSELSVAAHLRDHPNCTYGNKPHFVPPCFGDIGFFMCDPPADIRNHTRCRPPFDHEHEDHKPEWMFGAAP